MPTGDTIAALASGHAPAPRAIIRVSGPAASRIVRERLIGTPAGTRWAGLARWRLDGAELPVRVSVCTAPRSYTGEDTLELHLPGNPTLVRRVLGGLTRMSGVRHAAPGEFSARAYLNGRLTLAQAEAVAGLISASSKAMFDAAREALTGRSGARYLAWAEEIAGLLALVEAGIDFTDQEDVVAIERDALQGRVGALCAEMTRATGREPVSAPSHHPRVVLAGPPSAGKSTLFNALLGRRRAVVSPEAGTTRDALIEPLTLCEDAAGPVTVDLVDLAGLDEGAGGVGDGGAVHAAAQARAREHIGRAAVVLWCEPADAPRGGHEPGVGGALIRVRTRADLAPIAEGRDELPVCALDGRGLPALRAAIYRAAWSARGATTGPGAILPRHRDAIAAALARLKPLADRLADPDREAPGELTAEDLRAALEELGTLTGRVERDEILGRVFASFCIGK